MIPFNSNHIFVNYLKEFLSTYNLPKFKVYTQADAKYALDPQHAGEESPDIIESIAATNNTEVEGKRAFWQYNYLRQNSIQRYRRITPESGKPFWRWETIPQDSFYVGKKDLNNTKRLLLKTTTYDFYTHKYLGEYLRFKRDYYGFNLMPLYNCFTEALMPSLDITIRNGNSKKIATFLSSDKNFKIYYIPVKLFQNYTIAIDSTAGIEMCCCLFDGEYLRHGNTVRDLYNLTYKKFPRTFFNKPILYTALTENHTYNGECSSDGEQALEDLVMGGREKLNQVLWFFEKYSLQTNSINLMPELDNLTLLLKVPTGTSSTITILEGDYRNFNNITFSTEAADNSTETLKNNNQTIASVPKTGLDPEALALAKKYSDSNMVLTCKENHWVTNYEVQYKPNANMYLLFDKKTPVPSTDNEAFAEKAIAIDDKPFTPITHLQLLEFNTKKSYPFADRLIEYLLENTISAENPELEDNVKRVQTVLKAQNTGYTPFAYGIWDEEIRRRLYDFMYTQSLINKTANIVRRDCFGYCDKDIENLLVAKDSAGNQIMALSSVDIYGEKNN